MVHLLHKKSIGASALQLSLWQMQVILRTTWISLQQDNHLLGEMHTVSPTKLVLVKRVTLGQQATASSVHMYAELVLTTPICLNWYSMTTMETNSLVPTRHLIQVSLMALMQLVLQYHQTSPCLYSTMVAKTSLYLISNGQVTNLL